jgi:hypothetical protein
MDIYSIDMMLLSLEEVYPCFYYSRSFKPKLYPYVFIIFEKFQI